MMEQRPTKLMCHWNGRGVLNDPCECPRHRPPGETAGQYAALCRVYQKYGGEPPWHGTDSDPAIVEPPMAGGASGEVVDQNCPQCERLTEQLWKVTLALQPDFPEDEWTIDDPLVFAEEAADELCSWPDAGMRVRMTEERRKQIWAFGEIANALDLPQDEPGRVVARILEMNVPCGSCGAPPGIQPGSMPELPIVKGALDAQQDAEERMFAVLAENKRLREQIGEVSVANAELGMMICNLQGYLDEVQTLFVTAVDAIESVAVAIGVSGEEVPEDERDYGRVVVQVIRERNELRRRGRP